MLPLALPKLYTYAVPKHLENNIVVGGRVEVQFGKQKLYTALVHSVSSIPPVDYIPKEILSVIDEKPIVTEIQLQFWEWIASYYMCTLGDVMQAALPASFKLDSETYFVKNPLLEIDIVGLPDDEYMISEALNHQEEISLNDVVQILQKKTIAKPLKSLLEKKIIYIKETLHEKYTPKMETFVVLSPQTTVHGPQLKNVFDMVSKYPKQEAVLLAFLELSKGDKSVKRSELLKRANANTSSLESLVKKEIFITEEKKVDRISINEIEELKDFILSVDQKTSLLEIKDHFKEKDVVLLHGITSSGKTLLYIDLIGEQLAQGKQVLYLLPEIALTTQLIQRMEKILGNIAVYHSKFNNAERVEIWNKVSSNETKIILGARSSVFLPFQDLGLIIVDEEHDSSYKQYDPSPRYQCRDAAIYLAKQFDAKVLLGSATPSVESYSNARSGKYGLVKLNNRYGDIQLPEMEFVSLTDANKKKEVVSGITYLLRDEIQSTLDKKQQVILFQNRRGYAPYIACGNCNWIPMCKNCDVSLTYHKFTNDLRCHYCGYTQSLVSTCKACGSHEMQQKGLGTERIEEDLKIIFPSAKIGRMDYDTVRTKKGHEKIIEAFEEGEFDILVGTQMVTKGLDFGNVSLVGVLNADALMFYPDFRAFERAYQLLVQVSGRAGRRNKRGKVMIQIGNVHHVMVDIILNKTYDEFYQLQLQERKQFNYPPFSRLIQLTVKHKDIKTTIEAANRIAEYLNTRYEGFVIGPNAPIIQKINNYYLRDILVKIPKNYRELQKIKNDIREAINGLYQFQSFKQIKVVIDVDCY
ncbi:MAG: primosomal protein [Bacteroidota bacterium]|nr:primosomal protein [Bacteroidota bacterium]